jgi:hypothetical protein
VTLNVTDGAGAHLSAQTIVVVGGHVDPLAAIGGIGGAFLLLLVGVALVVGAWLVRNRRRTLR